MTSGFRTWLYDSVEETFLETEFAPAAWLFFENDELRRQGYRQITAKFDNTRAGIKAGQQVYWHPETKHMVPVGGQEPSTPTQPASPPSAAQPVNAFSPPPNRFGAQPQRPVTNSEPPGQGGETWVCAEVVGRILVAPKGSKIVLKKSPKGFEYLTANGKTGTFPEQGIQNFVKSIKDEATGKVRRVTDPNEYFQDKTPKGQSDQAEPQQQQGGVEDPKSNQYVPANVQGNQQFQIPPQHMNEYTSKIQDHFLGTDQNMMLNALAGTGKTTMLKHLSSFAKPGEQWLYIVFNRKNMQEATYDASKIKDGQAKCFPPGIEVYTSHGFIGRKVLSNGSGMLPQTELPMKKQPSKINRLLMDRANPWYGNLSRRAGVPQYAEFKVKLKVKTLVGLCKNNNINPEQGDVSEQIMEVMHRFGFDPTVTIGKPPREKVEDFTKQIVPLTQECLRATMPGQSPDPRLRNLRDHDDTLWWVAMYADQINWPKYDVVLADEVQDFNVCQQVMLKKLHDAGARIVCVGDPNQAIYMFRGADSHAFDNLNKMLSGLDRGAAEFALPINFRCCEQIVDFVNQNTHVNNLICGRKSKDGSGSLHQGVVTTDRNFAQSYGDLITEHQQGNGLMNKPTAMIARQNAPLIAAAIELMRNNVEFNIIGREFSEEIINHMKEVIGRERVMSLNMFGNALADALYQRKAAANYDITKAESFKEYEQISKALMSMVEMIESGGEPDPNTGEVVGKDPKTGRAITDTDGLQIYVKNMFGGFDPDDPESAAAYAARDKRQFVTLSSAHRSKGLEFPRVFILNNDKFMKKAYTNDEEQRQDLNAKYVAYTRAEDELHVLADGP